MSFGFSELGIGIFVLLFTIVFISVLVMHVIKHYDFYKKVVILLMLVSLVVIIGSL